MKDCPDCIARDEKRARKLRRTVKALARDLTAVAMVGFLFVLIVGGMAAVGIVACVKLKALERRPTAPPASIARSEVQLDATH